MKHLFIILSIFWTLCEVSAQIKIEPVAIPDRGRMAITIPNVYPLALGENIKYISFFYRNNKLTDVVMNFDTSKSDANFDPNITIRNRSFDLTIKGDAMLMQHLYPNLAFPYTPHMINQTYLGAKDSTMIFNIYRIDVHQDSTAYTYFRGKEIGHSFSSGLPARLNADLQQLSDHLKKQIKKLSLTDKIDSAIVYEAIVSKKGEIENIKLILGNISKVTEVVKRNIQEAKWLPATQSSTGAHMRVKMRIYVELDRAGNVIVKLPNRLYNNTGD